MITMNLLHSKKGEIVVAAVLVVLVLAGLYGAGVLRSDDDSGSVVTGFGVKQRDERCVSNDECVAGLVCRPSNDWAVPHCQSIGLIGVGCDEDVDCDARFACVNTRCAERQAQQQQQAQAPPQQQAAQQQGSKDLYQACGSNGECRSGVCRRISSSDPFLCHITASQGVWCDETADCGQGLSCVNNHCGGQQQQPQQPAQQPAQQQGQQQPVQRQVGESCRVGGNDCVTSYCKPLGDPTVGRCAKKENNQRCNSGVECSSETCHQNRCVEPRSFNLPRGCGSMEEVFYGHNDPSDTRYNFLFVGINTPQNFRMDYLSPLLNFKDENIHVRALFSLEPFKSNKQRFNFWYYYPPVSVSFPPGSTLRTLCSEIMTNKLPSLIENWHTTCGLPNTRVIFLIHENCRASAGWKHVLISMEHPHVDHIISHELGHTIGDLSDEYFEEGKPRMPSFPDCAPNRQTAEQWWGDLVGRGEGDERIGYFEGCSYASTGTFRPTIRSIMRGRAPFFGLVNNRHLCYQILKNTGRVDAACARMILDSPLSQHRDERRDAGALAGRVVQDMVRPGVMANQQLQSQLMSPRELQSRMVELGRQIPRAGMVELSRFALKPVVSFALVKQQDNTYLVDGGYRFSMGLSHDYFEQGPFDSEVNVYLNGREYAQGINLQEPVISEHFDEEGDHLDDYSVEDVGRVFVSVALGDYFSQLVTSDSFSFDLTARNLQGRPNFMLSFSCSNNRCVPIASGSAAQQAQQQPAQVQQQPRQEAARQPAGCVDASCSRSQVCRWPMVRGQRDFNKNLAQGCMSPLAEGYQCERDAHCSQGLSCVNGRCARQQPAQVQQQPVQQQVSQQQLAVCVDASCPRGRMCRWPVTGTVRTPVAQRSFDKGKAQVCANPMGVGFPCEENKHCTSNRCLATKRCA